MSEDSIKRYTELPFVLQALQEKKLALLNPTSWDDKNDAHYVQKFKQRSRLRGVFALCLTEATQTYHHWRIFTHGASGACIHFKKNEFQQWVDDTKGLVGQRVQYRTIPQLRAQRPELAELPFIKRDAYRHETEYRLLHTSRKTSSGPVSFEFPVEIVERVVLNPWLHASTLKSIKALIHTIHGWKSLRVIPATIVNNDEWRKMADAEL